MGLHITKDRDNLKEEVIEINEQYSTDFGFYYYDIEQRHIDALNDYQRYLATFNDLPL